MKCLYFSNPDRRSGSKHRFSWSFFSQGSSSASSEAKKSSHHLSSSSSQQPDTLESFKQRTSSDHDANPIEINSKFVVALPVHGPSSSASRPLERIFTYSELRAVTKNFSGGNLIGEGGFGCVYKGLLKSLNPNESPIEVAVKQLNRKGQQGHKEWLAEIRFLSLVEHPNLVKLIGYCAEDDVRGIQRLLVYEYMANGSLEDHLFGRSQEVLSWQKRLLILLGAAQGLAYLHEGINGIQVIFRDFKTSNVLLDKDFTPKLSDFGMARQGPEMGESHVSTMVVGTLGYAAPEYINTGHLTSKSDVWSFGVVLLEILSGRRSLDRNRPKGELKLVDWAKPYIQGNPKVEVIMDPRLEGQYSLIQAQKIASLAYGCLAKHARARPLMSKVVECLKEILEQHMDNGNLRRDVVLNENEKREGKERDISNLANLKDSKRRRLIFKDVMSLKSREDARNLWRVWIPKEIQT